MRIFLLNGNKVDGRIYPLSEKERNYIKNVLRIKEGAVFKAKDPKENLYDATLEKNDMLFIERSSDNDNYLDEMPSYSGEFVKINVYQCICKGKKNAQITRQLQEAGASKLTFIESALVQQKEIDSHEINRLETIRNEAVQQSGAKLCQLCFNIGFKKAIEEAKGLKIILHQGERKKSEKLYSLLEKNSEADEISIFIGSEGGFTDEECLIAEEAGFHPVILNTNILRAETAGIYTMGAIQSFKNR